MDDEAKVQLIAQATIQDARLQAREARRMLPWGLVLIGLGIAVASLVAIFPLGLIGSVVIGGFGFILIPLGIAVLAKSFSTIARSDKRLRELQPPVARVTKS